MSTKVCQRFLYSLPTLAPVVFFADPVLTYSLWYDWAEQHAQYT